MLEQAIVEAEELKRVASRNAESAILEKYSRELKEEMENLIEQDLGLGADTGLGGGMDFGLGGEEAKPSVDFEGSKADNDEIPAQLEYAAFDGMTIGKTKYPKEEEVIEINLDALSEYELNPDAGPTNRNIAESIELDDSLLAEMATESMEESKLIDPNKGDDDDSEGHSGQTCAEAHPDLTHESYLEEMELNEKIESSLEEAITIAWKSVKEGNPFGSDTEQDEFNLLVATLKQEAEELKKKNESLSKRGNKLIKENAKYKKNFDSASKKAEELNDGYSSLLEKFKKLRMAFDESQLMNAKLVYTNQVLSDDKLNVRQKNKIVESIQEAASVDNAKIMYETLVNAVESTSKRRPESLSEAVARRPSPLLIKAARTEDKTSDDFTNRMKRLAGIDI
tara:strand:- start:425 stop:1612 length:1188 start_codon:yes stop_codon:yes gene_type:complete